MSYVPEINIGVGRTRWLPTALRFVTEAEALAYILDTSNLSQLDVRAVQSEEPALHRWINKQLWSVRGAAEQ